MNRPVTAVFAALESLLVVGIGVGVPVVALTFLWAFQYGLQIDWLVFWRAGADVWLVGHGVDLTLTLSAATAKATGLGGATAPILISVAALGFALLTLLLGARVGRRLAETKHRATGSAVAIGVFAVLSLVVTVTARHPMAEPSVWQGILWPTLIFGVPLVVAAEIARRRRGEPADAVTAAALSTTGRIPMLARVITLASLRAGVSAAMAVLAFSGVVVALLLLFHYASIITLFEAAHAGVLGSAALTIGQIALVPNAIGWTMSWFVGPGFALGAGSAVSPLGTTIGPMPAVPFLGALPTTSLAFGFVGLLVPIGAGFVVATMLRPSIERALAAVPRSAISGPEGILRRHDLVFSRAIVGVAVGVVGGVVLGFVALVSGGSGGPGRLAEIGSHPLTVGGLAALEIGLPAVLALVVTQPEWATRERLVGDLADVRPSDLRRAKPGRRDEKARDEARDEPSRDEPSRDEPARDEPARDEQATDVIVPASDRPAPAEVHAGPSGGAAADDDSTERLDGFTR